MEPITVIIVLVIILVLLISIFLVYNSLFQDDDEVDFFDDIEFKIRQYKQDIAQKEAELNAAVSDTDKYELLSKELEALKDEFSEYSAIANLVLTLMEYD